MFAIEHFLLSGCGRFCRMLSGITLIAHTADGKLSG